MRGSACEGRPAPEPSFAQRDRASGMGGKIDVFLKDLAETVLKTKSELLRR